MKDLFNKLGISKRWLTTLLYMLMVAGNKKLGLDISDEMLMTCAGLLGGYIVGESYTKGKTGSEDLLNSVVDKVLATLKGKDDKPAA